MHTLKNSALAAALALAACGSPTSSGTVDGGGDAATDSGTGGAGGTPLIIATDAISTATVGKGYGQPVTASGGKKPYLWGVSTAESRLTWLRIDGSTGALSGLPNQALPSGGRVTVAVTDQNATTVTKDFLLTVLGCTDGELVDCVSSDGGVCALGKQQCTGGTLAAECSGTLSTDKSRCGATCGPCDARADSCVDGACACGSGPACGAGQACCGGSCVALDSPSHCGSCTNDCLAQMGPNVSATCSSGQCAYSCKANFQNCTANPTSAGCDSSKLIDPHNCGACGNDCMPAVADAGTTWAGCDGGACQLACKADALDCDGTFRTGCEQPVDTTHCGSCAAACTAAGTGHVLAPHCNSAAGAWKCQPDCQAGWANCDGQDSNGCEVDTASTFTACGTCTKRCNTVMADNCSGGTCKCGVSPSCDPVRATACVGGSCKCGTNAGCGIGSRCVNGACVCDSTSCSGCCKAGVCYAGTTNVACGYGGNACGTCNPTVAICTPCTAAACGGSTSGGSCQ